MPLDHDLFVGNQIQDDEGNIWTIVRVEGNVAWTHEWLPDQTGVRNSFIFRYTDDSPNPEYNQYFDHVDQN